MFFLNSKKLFYKGYHFRFDDPEKNALTI